MQEQDVGELIEKLGAPLFDEIARVFNFAFEYRNEEYEPVTSDWVCDNLSIRELGEILQEVLKMNKLEWMLPFFRDQVLAGLAKMDIGQNLETT